MGLRRYSGALLVALGAIVLGGCGGGQERAGGEPTLETLDPQGQEVVFWYQHAEEREEALRRLIDEFNQSNPHGITVKGEHVGGHDEIYEKMLVRMQGGALPQLVVAYRYQAQAYYSNGGVVDLLPYMDSPRWGLSGDARGDYFQEFIEQDRIQGRQIAFLPSRSMEVVYYNVEWLQELGFRGPPQDWEAFVSMCRKATQQPFSGATGSGPSYGLALNVDASRLAAMVFSRGGDLVSPGGASYALDTPEMRASLSMLRELTQDGAAVVMDAQTGIRQAFSQGRALFVMRSSSGMTLYRGDVAAGAGFEWDVAPVPHTVDRPVLNVYGASLAVCKTTPEQQLAAWLFIKWFTEPDQQDAWSRASGYFPVRRSTARDIASYFRVSYGLLEEGKREPWLVGYGGVRQMIEETMTAALQGGDIPSLLQELEVQANRTLE